MTAAVAALLAVAVGVVLGAVIVWPYTRRGNGSPVLSFGFSFRLGMDDTGPEELRAAVGYTGAVNVDPSVDPVWEGGDGEERLGFKGGAS